MREARDETRLLAAGPARLARRGRLALGMLLLALVLFWPVLGAGLYGDPVSTARLLTIAALALTFAATPRPSRWPIRRSGASGAHGWKALQAPTEAPAQAVTNSDRAANRRIWSRSRGARRWPSPEGPPSSWRRAPSPPTGSSRDISPDRTSPMRGIPCQSR